MSSILQIRGARALSAFRLAKLLASLQKADPGVRSVAAEFRHHDAGIGRRQPVIQDGLVGLAGDDIEQGRARSATGGHGGIVANTGEPGPPVLAALPVLPFDLEVSRLHAQVWADLRSRGEMIGKKGNDLVSIPLPQINLPQFRYGQKGSGVQTGKRPLARSRRDALA